MRADRDSYYRPSMMAVLLALGAAFLLAWHGMAWADSFNPLAGKAAQLPDTVQGQPGADRIPPGLACTDNMDLTPEDSQPSPFDADTVALHMRANMRARPITNQNGCPDRRPARTINI